MVVQEKQARLDLSRLCENYSKCSGGCVCVILVLDFFFFFLHFHTSEIMFSYNQINGIKVDGMKQN